MTNLKLKNYILESLNSGNTLDAVWLSLEKSGYSKSEFDQAVNELENHDNTPNIQKIWDIKTLFINTFKLYKRRFKQLLLSLMIAFISAIIPIYTYISLLTSRIFNNTSFDTTTIFGMLFIIFGLNLIIYLTLVWGKNLLDYTLWGDFEDKGLKEIISLSTKALLSNSLLYLLLYFIIIGGFFALIIPGVIFSIWLLFTPFIHISGEKSIIKSFSSSIDLTSKLILKIILRIFLVVVPTLLITSILGFILYNLYVQNSDLLIVICSITVVISLLLYSFWETFIYSLFINISEFKNSTNSKSTESFWPIILASLLGYAIIIIIFILKSYMVIDSSIFGKFKSKNDIRSQANVLTIKNALDNYYNDLGFYPSTMQLLIPTYLPVNLYDPNIGKAYEYQQIEEGSNYNLCLPGTIECIHATSSDKPLPNIEN